jgi:hypothetical protein
LRDSAAMAPSLSAHNVSHAEQEIDPSCTCIFYCEAEVLNETAHAALETALSTEGVETLRKIAEAAWRSEQDIERLRARAVRVCQETPALAKRRMRRMRRMARVRTTLCSEELREVGLESVRTADKDTLYAMAVQAAAQDGADVNTRAEAVAGEEPKESWLRVAARNGHVETLRALVAAGAEVDHAGNTGFTALYAAALCGHVEAIQALLSAGADLNRAANDGCTPLAIARANNQEAAVLALVQAGATQ